MRALLGLLVTLAAILAAAAPAPAAGPPPPGGVAHVRVPRLAWLGCGPGLECTTATVPRDYTQPTGPTLDLAVIRAPATDPAHRIGSLFLNPGGPGGSGVDLIRGAAPAFAALNARFDLVSWDPRGVGASVPAVRCLTDAEADQRNNQPFDRPPTFDAARSLAAADAYVATCDRRNPGILPYLGTENVARDLDVLRAAVGDAQLTYLGFSYGTAIGATYATLFGARARALALDGALDADGYFNRPSDLSFEQTGAFERALGRFFDRCAAEQAACGFGAGAPREAFDALTAQLDATPLALPDGRRVDGDVARIGATLAMYRPDFWPILAQGLVSAQNGDGRVLRIIADAAIGRDPLGHYDGSADRFFTIYGVDAAWPRDPAAYAAEGGRSYSTFPHFWFNHGYSELPWGRFAVQGSGVYRGPFANPPDAPTTLVIGTTFDPATPYGEAQALTAQLGNARLLTMDGDGHTASFAHNTPCIDDAVVGYLVAGTLPAQGTVCVQQVNPFAAPAPVAAGAAPVAAVRRAVARLVARTPVAIPPPAVAGR